MPKLPRILMTANSQARGTEFGDFSVSLSNCYARAITAAGGIPLVAPNQTGEAAVAGLMDAVEGLLLTGGDDLPTRLYAADVSPAIERTVSPGQPERDLMELQLIREAVRQRKPLLAICRGHQILNVAFGGTLVTDISLQVPGALNHRHLDRKDQLVHRVVPAANSFLARVCGRGPLGINSSHHQAVGRVAEVFRVVARTSDGVVEAMELAPGARDLFPYLLSVQYHPERLCDRHPRHRALFLSFTKACRRR